MINIAISNEQTATLAQRLGHHKDLQETVEKAVDLYLQYLQQQAIRQAFGTVDFSDDYDYKKQRGVL